MKKNRFFEQVKHDALVMLRELFTEYDFNKLYEIVKDETLTDTADKFHKDREIVILEIEGLPLFYVSVLRGSDKEFRPFGLKLVDRDNFVTIHLEFDENLEHICFISNVRGNRDYLNIYNLNTLESRGVTIDKINDIVNMLDVLVEGIEKEYPEIKKK